MRVDLFLFIFALILAFLTGNMAYFIKSEEQGSLKTLKKIQQLHIELQEEVIPSRRLDLNSDYPSEEHLKLIQKNTALPSQKNKIILNSSECLKSKISQLSSNFINKETLWLGYLCNQIDKLPLNFFSSPPYVHSNGVSYSYMKFKMINSHLERIDWLESHAKYMHINELKGIGWPTNANQRFLISLEHTTLQKIIDGENTFLSPRFYFIKTGNLKYYVIDKEIALRFFNRASFSFSEHGQKCLFQMNNVCWKKSRYSFQSFFSQSTFIIFFGTIIILIVTARSLLHRLRKKKIEEERKKHALRVLTHELRTPIASLIVQMNELNRNQQNLPQEFQESLLRVESQVYRLKHLAEKSRSYLQSDDQKLISLNNEVIESMNHFIEEILFEYNENEIIFTPNNDFSISVDIYWLKMCIMNLIDNARRYGKLPIEIKTSQLESLYTIEIIDQGKIPYKNLKELLKTKHKDSKGLGLGLLIVNKTLKQMDAKLELFQNPTRFKISIPKIKKNKESNNEKNTTY